MSDQSTRTVDLSAQPLGSWITIGDPSVAEAIALLDPDFVLIDSEHTALSLKTVENMVRAVESTPGDTSTFVRAPWNDHVRLKQFADLGVDGVMVPMIDSEADAARFVEALQYPPDGIRGIAGGRASSYGRNLDEYVSSSNGTITTIAQIETKTGVDNAEAIAAVEGLDALFVGPADLSGALGCFGDLESETFNQAVETVVNAGRAADIPVGTFTADASGVAASVEKGFDFLMAGKDVTLLMNGVEAVQDTYEDALRHSPAPNQR